MTAAGNAKRKKRAVMKGGRGNLCCENETMMYINRSVLLKPIMRDIIFDRPIRFEIPGKLKKIPIFAQFPFGCFSFFSLFQPVLADGMTGRLNQTGVNGYTFVDV